MGWYGPQTGDCSCCPPPGNECKILIDDFNRADNDNVGADWTEQLAGSGWEISGNVLTTDVADDLITANDGHPDGDSDLRAWARVRGAVDDQLRVVVCYVDDDNYLFGQVEIADDCVLLTLWKRVLGVNTQLGETLVAFTEQADGWHTLLVCHQGEYYPSSQWLSARLITADNVIRYLVEEVDTAVSEYGGLGTGSLNSSAPIAEFDDFNLWILQSPTWPQCPDCEYRTCVIGRDDFLRPASTNLGCEWVEVSGNPEIVPISFESVMRFTAAGTAIYQIPHPEESLPDVAYQYVETFVDFHDATTEAVLYLDWLNANNHHKAVLKCGVGMGTSYPFVNGFELTLFKVTGGVATQIGTAEYYPMLLFYSPGVPKRGVFRFCLTPASVLATFALFTYTPEQWFYLGNGGATTPHGGRYAGVGAGAVYSSLDVYYFDFERRQSVAWPECPACVDATLCTYCQDPGWPRYVLVTVEGMVDGGELECADCDSLNGSFVIKVEPRASLCYSASNFEAACIAPPLGPFDSNLYTITATVLWDFFNHYRLRVVLFYRISGLGIEVHYILSLGETKPNCMAFSDVVVPYSSGHVGICSADDAIVTVSAIEY